MKIGKAAFMKTQEDAEVLADYMVNILFDKDKSDLKKIIKRH